jgi:hypothetical protein
VLIELGPVSATSARAWIAYAGEMLELLQALPEGELPAPALDAFASLLDQWRPVAERGEPFRWTSEEEPERVQYLLKALYVAGTLIEREASLGRAHLRPADADAFHFVLVRETFDALEHESKADAEFVTQMRNIWDVARRD